MQAERPRRLPLPARHRPDGAAENLRLVGGGVQREGEDRAIERVAEEDPEPDRLQLRHVPANCAGAVVDEEELREQRRAAEEIDVAEGDRADEAVLRQPRGGDRDREQQRRSRTEIATSSSVTSRPVRAAAARTCTSRSGIMPAAPLGSAGGAVRARWLRSDQRSIAPMPNDETIDIRR